MGLPIEKNIIAVSGAPWASILWSIQEKYTLLCYIQNKIYSHLCNGLFKED
jgi:hypothetical protein